MPIDGSGPEIFSPEATREFEKKSNPYYLSQEESDALRDKVEINITPEQNSGFREVEAACSEAFLKHFGNFLNEEQRKYFSSSRVMVPSIEQAKQTLGPSENTIRDQDKDKVALNGLIYNAYYTHGSSSPLKDMPGKDMFIGEGMGRQLWAGRIPLVPVLDKELEDTIVDPKWLMTEREFGEWQHEQADFNVGWAAIKPYVTTKIWAAVALHEKVHGIQPYDLPLPILEAAANFYEREAMRQSGWQERKNDEYDGLTTLWQEVVTERGEQAHRYIFGNLEDTEHQEMHEYMKAKFSKERIEEASPALIWEIENDS